MSVASSTGTATSRPPILARVESSTVRAQLAMAKERGVYAFSYVFEGAAGPMFRAPSGQQVLNFGSNNYLGLTTHPRVVAAARAAVDDFGTGCTGSRLMNGTLRLHIALEEELADFYGKEAALVATTGFGANMSVLTTLTRPGDWLVCDRDIHASLLEGAAASGARVSRFRHNDLRSLGQRLARVPAEDGLLVLIEGVYSADGSVAPVADVVAATRSHNGAVLVDEAHALGVLGALGRGACEEAGCLDDVDLVTV